MPACKGGRVVRALTSHPRDLGLNPSVEACIYELSLKMVLSLALQGFFWFSFLLRNQHFQIPIQFRTHRDISTSSLKLLSALWVNKLQNAIFTNIAYHTSTFSEQGSFRITSGAIHATVPAKVILALLSLNSLLVPKSDILSISSAPTRTLWRGKKKV